MCSRRFSPQQNQSTASSPPSLPTMSSSQQHQQQQRSVSSSPSSSSLTNAATATTIASLSPPSMTTQEVTTADGPTSAPTSTAQATTTTATMLPHNDVVVVAAPQDEQLQQLRPQVSTAQRLLQLQEQRQQVHSIMGALLTITQQASLPASTTSTDVVAYEALDEALRISDDLELYLMDCDDSDDELHDSNNFCSSPTAQ